MGTVQMRLAPGSARQLADTASFPFVYFYYFKTALEGWRQATLPKAPMESPPSWPPATREGWTQGISGTSRAGHRSPDGSSGALPRTGSPSTLPTGRAPRHLIKASARLREPALPTLRASSLSLTPSFSPPSMQTSVPKAAGDALAALLPGPELNSASRWFWRRPLKPHVSVGPPRGTGLPVWHGSWIGALRTSGSRLPKFTCLRWLLS